MDIQSHSMDLLTPSSRGGITSASWPLRAPGYIGGGLPSLSQPFVASKYIRERTGHLPASPWCYVAWVTSMWSQWSSGSMSDCGVRGPGIESRCGQLCLSHNHCDLQPWAWAVCTLPAVPRSTQPSTLWGTVNEYQLSGWVIIINGDGGCRR